MSEVMLIDGAIKYQGKGTTTVTKEQADFMRAGTHSGLKKNPELSKFVYGLENAMRKDLGISGNYDQGGVACAKPKKKK